MELKKKERGTKNKEGREKEKGKKRKNGEGEM